MSCFEWNLANNESLLWYKVFFRSFSLFFSYNLIGGLLLISTLRRRCLRSQDRDCLFSLQSSVFVFPYSYYYTDPRRDARPQAIRYCTYILLLALCPRACACVCRVVWIQPALRTFSDSDSDDTYSRNRQSNRTTCSTNAPTGSCASSRFSLDYHQRKMVVGPVDLQPCRVIWVVSTKKRKWEIDSAGILAGCATYAHTCVNKDRPRTLLDQSFTNHIIYPTSCSHAIRKKKHETHASDLLNPRTEWS